jgi:putative endonuclease
MRQKGGWTYLMTNRRAGTLCTGVTNDLIRRVSEHRSGEVKCFTQRYWLKQLVHFEWYDDIRDAIAREKAIKNGTAPGKYS